MPSPGARMIGRRTAGVLLLLATLSLSAAAQAQAQTFRYADSWDRHGLTVSRQTDAGLRLNLSLASWELATEAIDGRGRNVVRVPGVFLPGEAGAPDLPAFSRLLALPEGATAQVTVLRSRAEVLAGVDLAPAPVIPPETEDGLRYERDAAIYATDAPYPAEILHVGEVTEVRGVDAVMVGVTPFQYNPVTGELTVHRDIEIEVVFTGGRGQVGEDRLRNRWFEPILRDAFANADLLPPLPPAPRPAGRTPDLEYVIITPPATTFTAWADTLARFRNQQGIRTGVVTTDQIGGNTAAAIEAYIDQAYHTWDIPPVAVLLLGDHGGGDAGIIAPTWNGYCVSDNLYADVTGNDLPDVILARMAAANPTHVETFVRKVIDYERQPPTTPGYYQNPIIAGGWQTERWFILCDEVLHGFLSNALGKTPVREYAIYQGTPGSIWSTAPSTATVVDYFGPGGLGYLPATPGHLDDWNGSASRLNAGLESGAFMLQHRDHGDVDGWGEPAYSRSHVAALDNADPSFVFSINCLTGKFDASSECFAETFHRHASGALGVIAASEISYSFVNDTYVWGMFDSMWPDFDPGYGAAGDHRMLPAFANAAGKYYLNASNWPYNSGDKEVTHYLFHHHGDAFSTVYSELPTSLDVAHDQALLSGVDFFEVTADAGALIGLSVGGELIGSAVATGGPVSIPIAAQLPGQDLLVTVTMQNRHRHEQPVPIIPPEGPWVIHAGHALNDLEGNGNGQLDFGESSLLSLELHNVGLETARRVTATLTSDDPYLTIDQADASFPDIPADGHATATDAYHLALAADVPDGHPIPITVTVADADSTYRSGFTLTAHAPVLAVPEVVISDDADADGILDPGESADLTVHLANTGSATALDLAATLASDNPHVTVDVDAAAAAALDGGATAPLVFRVTASEQASIGEPVSFLLAVTAVDLVYQTSLDMAVGLQIEDFESGDFLVFPWQAAGDQGWQVVTDDPFEGAHCARSGDIGHNQTSVLALEADVLTSGTISFQYRVDSESSYDFLRFRIDGTELGAWSGTVGWDEATFPVPAGVHVFEWVYTKDASVSDGADCGWVDQIVLPAVSEPPRPTCEVTPGQFEVTVAHPASVTEMLTLVNSGEGELEYTVELALAAPAPAAADVLTLKKGVADPRGGAPAVRGSGGPDPFGYTWVDSDEPGGPAHQWIEISDTGTPLDLADDQNAGPFDLGFAFPFYGVPQEQVRICSNGWLSFTSTSTAYSNQAIPGGGEPNNLVAPFWDDLDPASGGEVYYLADAANQRFIVQWDGVVHYGSGGGPETFQAVLAADGGITLSYQTVDSPGSCTVGIENAAGDTGLPVVFNAPYLHDGLTVRLQAEPLPEPWLAVDTFAGTVPAGGQAEVAVIVNSVDAELGSYAGQITLHTNDLENPQIQIPVQAHVVEDVTAATDHVPTAHALGEATPNPFNPSTTIAYAIPRAGRVTLRVFDVTGRLVRTLVSGARPAGRHDVTWDGRDAGGRAVASGAYYYRLDAPGYAATRKMMLIK